MNNNKFISTNLIQRSANWEKWRMDKIGASDCPIIMGASPWKTPRQLWEEKQGLREESYTSAAMQKGIDLEEEARTAFERHSGLYVVPRVIIHPEIHWMIASLDGMTMEEDQIVEIKIPGRKLLDQVKSGKSIGETPSGKMHYYQIQHQLACCGLQSAHLWVYNSDDKVGMLQMVDRDEDVIKEIIKKEREFYDCLRTACPPEDERTKTVAGDYGRNRKLTEALNAWEDSRENLDSAIKKEKLMCDFFLSLCLERQVLC